MTNKVAEYRTKNKLSQRALAEKAHVSISYIKVLENSKKKDNVSLLIAYRLAKVLGTSMTDLFNIDDESKDNKD